MILNSSENRWLKGSLITGLLAGLASAWLYLTGAFFMEFAGYSMEDATLVTAYQYWYHYGQEAGTRKWLGISSILAAVVVVAPWLLILIPKRRSLFGEARWAKVAEIRKAGLFADNGIIVGQLGGRYLLFGGSQHVLLAAPTRSGKGVGIVIPNMLNWADSVVVLDIKQENWDLTAGFRAEYGQACYLVNPAARDYRTHRWNPLHYLSQDPAFRINDIQKIAQMIWSDREGQDPIWSSSCRSLFLGLVLYLIETEGKPVTMGEVYRR